MNNFLKKGGVRMNLFKSLKNRKGMSGAIKASIVILTLAFVVASVSYIIPAFANTHNSIVTITPTIVKNGTLQQPFTAHVNCTGGPDAIHEFRIYEHDDFTNFVCDPVADWRGPYYAENTIGKFCFWTAKAGFEIHSGQSRDFTFKADTPATECCRNWLSETRDPNGFYVYVYNPICIDTTPPLTTKSYVGPQKQLGNTEWITSNTEVHLSATDTVGPHDSGILFTAYRDIYLQDPSKWHYCYEDCQNWHPCTSPIVVGDVNVDCAGDIECGGCPSWKNPSWSFYDGNPFFKSPESCHIIEYFSVDGIGNIEPIKHQCVFVDNTAPKNEKIIGTPTYGDCPKPIESCNGWDCLTGLVKDFFTTGRYGQNNPTGAWELAIWENTTGGEVVRAQDNYVWTNGVKVDFSLNYDPTNGMVTYTVDGKTLQWTYNSGKAFNYIIPFAKGNANGNSVELTEMIINGKAVPDLNSGTGYKGLKIPLTDLEQINGFTITGKAKLIWGTASNEIPGFHIFAMNTHNSNPQDCWVRDHVTPVTLDCQDQGPHPVEQETACYKISYDLYPDSLEQIGYITEQYCSQFGGFYNSTTGECCAYVGNVIALGSVDTQVMIPENKYTFNFTEDSVHDLEFYCKDHLGNTGPTDLEYFKVDSTPPTITKTMFGDYLGDCPPIYEPDGSIHKCYVADNGGSGVHVSVQDGGPICAVGILNCTYDVIWVTPQGPIIVESDWFTDSKDIIFDEDSTHILQIHCEDKLGNYVDDEEVFLVDSTPPETTKTIGDPYKIEPICYNQCVQECTNGLASIGPDPECLDACIHQHCTWWINSSTPITLTATDEKVGVDGTFYNNSIVPDNYCLNPEQNCYPIGYIPTETQITGAFPYTWKKYTGPIYKGEESCHMLIYWSNDSLGNTELWKWQCFFVDNTAPKGVKTIGEPNKTCEIDNDGYVPVATPDISERKGDVYESDSQLSIMNGPCSGATQPTQCAVFTTSSAPFYVKETLAAEGVVGTPDCGDIVVISSGNPNTAGSTISTSMGHPGCGNNPQGYGTYDCVDLIGFTPSEDSAVLAISSEWQEYAGSSFTDWMRIGGLVSVTIDTWGVPHWIYTVGPTNSGSRNLAVIKGGNSIDLRVADSSDSILDTALMVVPLDCFQNVTPPTFCGDGIVQPALGEECDGANDTACPGKCTNLCLCEEGPDCHWVRDHVTPVTLDCQDQGPHPVEQETACYKISYDLYPDSLEQIGYITDQYCAEFGGQMEGDWCCAYVGDNPYVFNFTEDSVHDLEFYCKDHLGNWDGTTDLEYFKVDSVPPTITKTINGPKYGDCPPENNLDCIDGNECYVDTATSIDVTATDGGPICAVGGVQCRWKYKVFGTPLSIEEEIESVGWEPWNYTFPIIFPEESYHKLRIECNDSLGNTITDTEWFIVDKTPPVTTKWYEGPQYPNPITDQTQYPHWITSQTEIKFSAVDPGPHPSGVNKTYYRISLVDEMYCHNQTICQQAQGGTYDFKEYVVYAPVNISEQSCHLIEYYSVDNVDKTEVVNKQCVYVENTPPVPNKEVGEPKTKWDGLDAKYYKWIKDYCWNGKGDEIECWKVTKFTPISLDCVDPEPHPVDNEKVCFNVELDNKENKTQKYCDQYQGTMGDDGFCCLGDVINDFWFLEETEHNLKYYCIDALGNKGPIDEEKFKVEGTKFEIPLFFKWNLISVPFTLLNDNPEEVFKDIKDEIDSVWTYDPEHVICGYDWCVWSPGDAPDNLKIKPGWGYWVLAKNGTIEDPVWLTIGGSLFSPATTPPTRDLVKGWNLIGYYGASWDIYNWGDFNFKCGDAFNFPDNILYGDKVYCALNSLVGEDGYPGWSGLWSYLSCGNYTDAWLGLNSCADPNKPLQTMLSRMYAGRGYWVSMRGDGSEYSPASTCIWNDNYKCVWTGGGIFP
jgi:hypothetical protein